MTGCGHSYTHRRADGVLRCSWCWQPVADEEVTSAGRTDPTGALFDPETSEAPQSPPGRAVPTKPRRTRQKATQDVMEGL